LGGGGGGWGGGGGFFFFGGGFFFFFFFVHLERMTRERVFDPPPYIRHVQSCNLDDVFLNGRAVPAFSWTIIDHEWLPDPCHAKLELPAD